MRFQRVLRLLKIHLVLLALELPAATSQSRSRYATVLRNSTENTMREKIFKYSTLSFILINFWTLYLFFDYFTEKRGIFEALGLFFQFVGSIMYAVGFSCVLLIIRLIFHLRNKTNPLKTNFFYILCGIFNLNNFIIWSICIILKILEIGNEFLTIFMISSLLISCFIIVDIYKSSFNQKIKTSSP